ncbi:hypothetical protein PENSPDRAFT_690840 [Peniophora sp. CONT]|nr:hypothetical protein PENSPDRAFT_690840 [Peniophora sp. CONT]
MSKRHASLSSTPGTSLLRAPPVPDPVQSHPPRPALYSGAPVQPPITPYTHSQLRVPLLLVVASSAVPDVQEIISIDTRCLSFLSGTAFNDADHETPDPATTTLPLYAC